MKISHLFLLAAFFGALIISRLLVPLFRHWCISVGLVDDPGHRKIHTEPVALAGGLAVITAILLPSILGIGLVMWVFPESSQSALLIHGFGRRGGQFFVILAGALAMVFLGWLDDKYELGALTKFAGQLAVAAGIACFDIRITLFVHNTIFSYAVTMLWIVTITNAMNFMDNMNGLCAGIGAIASGFFAATAIYHGQYLVSILALLTCGALLGFLPCNFPKASVFLGDAGSLLTGYLMAVLAILPHYYSPSFAAPKHWAVICPLLILAVPLYDLATIVLIRWRMGKPIYVGDTNHLSHRLNRRGHSKTMSVVIIWGAALITGSFSIVFW